MVGMYGKAARVKDIPEVTQYLAKNETFKKAALGLHQNKRNMLFNLEEYLDKELLGKETTKKLDEKAKKDDGRYK